MDHSLFFEADAPVAMIVVAAESHRIVLANSHAERLYGYAAEELVGKGMFELAVDRQSLIQRMQQALAGGVGGVHRCVHRRCDGKLISVSVAMGICRRSDEMLFVLYILDASAIERTEQRLEESLFRFKAVADYTYDWESWLDSAGRLVWVNPAVERLSGYTPAECLEMSDYPLPMIVPEDREAVAELIKRAIQGSSGNDVEFRVTHRDGVLRWIGVSWQPLRDADGDAVGVRMSMRDIDDRKGMEQRLRQYTTELERLVAERAARIIDLEAERSRSERLVSLGKLAAAVAHEINNPLAGIKNAFELLRSQNQENGQQNELWDLVGKEINRMKRVLQQMTLLYRPSTEPPQRLEVNSVIRELLLLGAGELAARRLQVHVLDDGRQWYGHLPEIGLRQILHNLLLNAMQASETGGEIQVQLEELPDTRVAITIRDFGEGLDERVRERIFEPFFTTKHAGNRAGSGLGLAISRTLAAAMGAELDFVRCDGRGAAFRLILPTGQPPA